MKVNLICTYIYWEGNNTDVVLNNLEQFLIRYKLITEKYKLSQFLNFDIKTILNDINEKDSLYFQEDYRRKWLKSNSIYDNGRGRVYPSLMFIKKNGEIDADDFVNIDPIISKEEFIKNEKISTSAPPLMIDFFHNLNKDEIYCNLEIDNDCFLPYLDNKKTRRMENSDLFYTPKGIDATELAYLNATRLNSFIRDWRYLCFEYGATKTKFESTWIGFSTMKKEFSHTYSENGVLFGDEIICYEDVYDLLPKEYKINSFEEIKLDIDKSHYDNYLKKRNNP